MIITIVSMIITISTIYNCKYDNNYSKYDNNNIYYLHSTKQYVYIRMNKLRICSPPKYLYVFALI